MRRLIPAAAAAATLVLAPTAAFVVATAGPAAAAGTMTITLTRITPTDKSTFTTTKGYTVTFVNADTVRHTITRTGGAWKSTTTTAVDPLKSVALGPLSSVGTYTYSDRYMTSPAVGPIAATYETRTNTIKAVAPATAPAPAPAPVPIVPTAAPQPPSTGGGAAPGSGTGGGTVPGTGGTTGTGGSTPAGTTPLAGGAAGPATSIGGTRALGSSNGALPPTGTTGFSYGYGGTSLSGLPMLGVGNLSVPPPAGISGPAPAVAPLLPGDTPTADQPLVTGGSDLQGEQATKAASVGDLRNLGLPAAVAAVALVGMISLLVRALLAEPLENLLGARALAH